MSNSNNAIGPWGNPVDILNEQKVLSVYQLLRHKLQEGELELHLFTAPDSRKTAWLTWTRRIDGELYSLREAITLDYSFQTPFINLFVEHLAHKWMNTPIQTIGS